MNHCTHDDGTTRMFCTECGKVREPGALASVNLAGFVGVQNSLSPAIEEFFDTGDPTTPGL